MPSTGAVPLLIDSVLKQWNNRCEISQWHEEYRLHINTFRAGKRMQRCSKITIDPIDAKYLIAKLNLNRQNVAPFRHGFMWRTAVSEIEMMRFEEDAYKSKNR